MSTPQITYTPPARSTSFVAYTHDTIDSADDTGQVQQFRSQVFVREFPSVLVKDHKTSTINGRNGSTFRTTSFTFDAESAGIPNFRHDFHASLAADDPAHDLLVSAVQRQAPVTVVLETTRKAKNDDGERIDPHVPIHELRGAQLDGSKGNSNVTKQNCKNLIAGVGAEGNQASFVVTTEATTVPADWALLRSNKDGSFAPPGWRPVDGGVANSPSPAPASTPSGVGEVDVDALAAAVAQHLAPIMAGDHGGRPRPALQQTHSSEAKAWEVWNTDGRINAGGFLLSKDRAIFTYAWRKVLDLGFVTEGDVEVAVRRLTNVMLWTADRVHGAVVGTVARHARTVKSHFEATKWVEFVIDQVSITEIEYELTGDVLASKDAMSTWARAVEARAARLFGQSLNTVEQYMSDNKGEATNSPVEPAAGPDRDGHPQAGIPEPSTAPTQPTRPTHGEAPTSPPTPAGQAPDVNQAAGGRPLDPWEEEPAPAATSTTPQPSTPTAADLGTEYLEFLGRVVDWGPTHPQRFQSLLQNTFGATLLRDIDRDTFAAKVADWDSDDESRASFLAAAYEAATAQAAGLSSVA